MYFIIFVLIGFAVAFAQENAEEAKVACYYANWSYKRGSPFYINQINPFLCTHLIYSFLTFDFENDGIASADEQHDIENGGFRHFNQLKVTNPKLKTLVAIGGWDEGGARFSQIARGVKRRAAFANNTRDFLKKHRFNGINIDWQYPTIRGGKKEDYENFVSLLKDMRTAFDADPDVNDKLLVTISVASSTDYIEAGYDLPKIAKYVEFMTIVCYDYHSSVEPIINHHSPIYPLPDEKEGDFNYNRNVDASIKLILKSGVPAEKFLLGIPSFGRTYILEDENEHMFGSLVLGEGKGGTSSREKQNGYRAFYEICAQIKKENWTVEIVNRTAVGPYAHKGADWVGYDDPESARIKGRYAKEHGLGGVMFWTIDDDDTGGECYDEGNPLINAAKRGYAEAKAPPRAPPITRSTVAPPMTQSTVAPLTPPTPASTPPQTAASKFPKRFKAILPPTEEIPLVQERETPPPRQPATRQPSIFIDRQKESGGHTYYQTISVWVVNNIFHWGKSDENDGTKIADVSSSFVPSFLTNLLNRL